MEHRTHTPTPAEFAAWRLTHPPMAGGDPAGDDPFAELTAKVNQLTERADTAVQGLEAAQAAGTVTPEQFAEVKALLEGTDEQPGLKAQIEAITVEREKAAREAEFKAMQGTLTTLQGAIADLRNNPTPQFSLGNVEVIGERGEKALLGEGDPYRADDGSVMGGFFRDVRLANRGVSDARERLLHGLDTSSLDPEGKALTEATPGAGAGTLGGTGAANSSTGGYLVRPQVERQIVLARESDNVLRQLCSSLNVTSNSISLDQLSLAASAGWLSGELVTKPESASMALQTITAGIFTAAGLVTISNQLLADSNPSVDQLFTAELAKRLVALEETAFLAGTGSGQPFGILNTPGIGSTSLATTPILDLLDAILDAIASVESNHGAPNAILMHPRTWTRILKARDAQGAYYIDPTGGPQDPRTGLRGPVKTLWGYPVITTNRMPTNLGGGTNESRVIVGDFRECLILDRQGITVDQSEHVYFMQNATVFRAEQRVGFTAARTPLAINVVGGAGLANG
jgi:HK97 family phage major capsid protein